MMKDAGCDIEVFAGSFTRNGLFEEAGVTVNRININDVNDFALKVLAIFEERHLWRPFDLFETPEINANAKYIAKRFPEIPFVTKLHTPVALQLKLLNHYQPLFNRLRFIFGALRRGRIDLGYWRKRDPNPQADKDYQMTIGAIMISVPSKAMKKWAVEYWKISPKKIFVIENPYSPVEILLKQVYNSKEREYLTFIGKLNIHKGMLNLTKALPFILKICPSLKVRFIGNDCPSHIKDVSMKDYMKSKLADFDNRIEFTGAISLTQIPLYLSEAKVCIFPSIWEAFGYVVLEAMSAGVPVIVSNGSGMQEIIDNDNAGVLVDPLSAKDISKNVIALVQNEMKMQELSVIGRKRVLQNYTPKELAQKHINFYQSVLSR